MPKLLHGIASLHKCLQTRHQVREVSLFWLSKYKDTSLITLVRGFPIQAFTNLHCERGVSHYTRFILDIR